MLSIENIVESFKKLNPLEHKVSDYWHYFRLHNNPVIALYIPRFQTSDELMPFDYEYLSRIIAVLRLVNLLRSGTGEPRVDIYLSTRSATLPNEFHSSLASLVLEPTNHNFSVVHKGEALIEVTLKLKSFLIPSNLWDQEQLLDAIQKMVWDIISVRHEYYPVARGQDIVFRDIFLLGAPIFSLRKFQIENDHVHLGFRVIFPPETTENQLKKKLLENLEHAYCELVSVKIEVLRDVAQVTPDKKIHMIAEETFKEIYGREPEYEWFPFPTVFNELSKTNENLLAVGPDSHLNLTRERKINVSEIEKDEDLTKFTQFILRLILKFISE